MEHVIKYKRYIPELDEDNSLEPVHDWMKAATLVTTNTKVLSMYQAWSKQTQGYKHYQMTWQSESDDQAHEELIKLKELFTVQFWDIKPSGLKAASKITIKTDHVTIAVVDLCKNVINKPETVKVSFLPGEKTKVQPKPIKPA